MKLAHSLVANARGIPVHSITLFILGGASNLEEEPQKPAAEFAMAIVGPVTSLVLAVIFWGLAKLPGDKTTPLAAILSYMAMINMYLGIFNLLPGFPLDGGPCASFDYLGFDGQSYQGDRYRRDGGADIRLGFYRSGRFSDDIRQFL